jgi:hypothetical protein
MPYIRGDCHHFGVLYHNWGDILRKNEKIKKNPEGLKTLFPYVIMPMTMSINQ